MTDYTPPPWNEVNFTFKGVEYAPPTHTEVNFTFGANDNDGPEAGLLKTNYTILLTI